MKASYSSRTSDVQVPELLGWKKLSVEKMSLASESSAFEPAKNVFLERPFFPMGDDK